MSVVNVSFGPGGGWKGVPVFSASPRISENLDGSSETDTTATAINGEFARIATDTAVWVTFGATPTAAAGTTFYIPAGVVEHFGPLVDGWKCSVIDA